MRHKNPYGHWENIDNPVPDCGCDVCQKLADRNQQRAERRSKKSRVRKPGAIARGVAAAGIAATVHGAANAPEQASGQTDHNWSNASAREEGANRKRKSSEETRSKGDRSRWSSGR